jgi:cysteinyl-tRNA synthetase
MPLQVYNTLTRRKEPFEPIYPPRVGVYVCGPTVYGHSHVGHAKSYVSFDVVVRWLRASGYQVNYVQNITDVGHLTDDADEGEDKVIKEARARGLHPMAVAEAYTNSYLEDMDALGVQRPDIQPRATGHIPEQIAMIQDLIEAGHAYATADGSVYYDVNSFEGYGKLSGRRIEEVEVGARVAPTEDKRDPRDFALWKAAPPEHIMKWPSPWGVGFPGWHIECSAMSTKYLGQPFDIHGGGLENQFPHHECEIAQAEGAHDQLFVKYWLHNHMITVNGEKMGKSKGNFILIKDLVHPDWPVHPLVGRKIDPLMVRYYILNSHYRSDLDFSVEGLEAAENGLRRLHTAVNGLRRAVERASEEGEPAGIDLAKHEQAFADAMDDDFNTPQAVAALFELTREVNTVVNSGRRIARAELEALDGLYRRLGGEVLGLVPDVLPQSGGGLEDGLMSLLIDMRKQARADRNFALADAIRDKLTEIGVVLEDTREGTTWRKG